MSPRFVLGRENVPCVAEVVNRSLKADCTDFKFKVCFLLEWCFITSIDTCWDMFQRTYVFIAAEKNL